MKKIVVSLVLAVMLLALPGQLFAAVTGDPIKTYGVPFLLTSGGQGPGSKMLRLLINQSKQFKLGTDFFLEDEPEPRLAEIEKGIYQVLIVVIGTTDKGLGASGITIEDEINNLKKVIALAQSKNLPIVSVSIEADKRSKIATNGNERIIDLVCPVSEWMIVLAANNSDSRFTKLSQEYGIPLTMVGSALELTKLCPKIFLK